MGFNKKYQVAPGSAGAYWCVIETVTNHRLKETLVVFGLYKDKKSAQKYPDKPIMTQKAAFKTDKKLTDGLLKFCYEQIAANAKEVGEDGKELEKLFFEAKNNDK